MKISDNLRNVNLNLLPVLRELLQWRSVTLAARSLNLTQSAVSASLKRLRLMFDDELLIPCGRDLVLTEKAEQLRPVLEELLASTRNFLGNPPFDPGIAQNNFVVATADYVTALFGPKLVPALQEVAPGLRVQTTPRSDHIFQHLRQGVLDLVIGPDCMPLWIPLDFNGRDSDLCWEPCFTDELVAIEHAETPEQDYDLETYLSRPHASFAFTADIHASVEQETLSNLGLRQNDQLQVAEFTLLPLLVTSTKCISVIPYSLASFYAAYLPIRLFTPPVQFPPIKLIMVWSRSRVKDDALAWFREQLKQCFVRFQPVERPDHQ